MDLVGLLERLRMALLDREVLNAGATVVEVGGFDALKVEACTHERSQSAAFDEYQSALKIPYAKNSPMIANTSKKIFRSICKLAVIVFRSIAFYDLSKTLRNSECMNERKKKHRLNVFDMLSCARKF